MSGKARTLMIDPVSNASLIAPVSVSCISRIEALAEKFRAALTRREVAIRDFYDLDYLMRQYAIRSQDLELRTLVKSKIHVPGNGPIDVGESRLAELRNQMDGRLKPVLREKDFSEFSLARAYETVTHMARIVA